VVKSYQNYHGFMKDQVPSLEQLDGYMLAQLFRVKQKPAEVEGISKQVDPKAKAMLEDVIMK
jgi:hypothetical protein